MSDVMVRDEDVFTMSEIKEAFAYIKNKRIQQNRVTNFDKGCKYRQNWAKSTGFTEDDMNNLITEVRKNF